MKAPLSQHLSFGRLILGALPSILMMVSISLYSVIDGLFVSNFAGKTQFAAVNLIYPYVMTLGALGFMMGTGGTALVAKKLGEGKTDEANRHFSNCVIFSLGLGLISTVISLFLLPNISKALGADEEMLPHCIRYGQILIAGVTFFNFQNLFQSFLMAAERPGLGFGVTLLAGITNIILDAALIAGAKMGIVGAGIGTIAGQFIGGVLPLIFFLRNNNSPLKLRMHKFDWKGILKMVTNGMSEFFANIFVSIVSIVMNILLMRHFGQDGVSAYGVICYVWLVYAAIFIGFNIFVAPRISYNLGANNKKELRHLYLSSLLVLLLFGVIQLVVSESLAYPLSYVFTSYDQRLLELTTKAMRIYSIIYCAIGINMFGSAFFTALNNGVMSLVLSTARLIAIELPCILLFSLLIGGDGIWWGVVVGELFSVLMNLLVMFLFRKRYGYMKPKEEAALS